MMQVRFKQILKNTENIATSLTELSSLLLQCHSYYRFRRNRNRNDNYDVQPPSEIRHPHCRRLKWALYRIWCGVNRLGDSKSGVNKLGDTSAFVIPAGQLLLTRRGKTGMYTVGIVFELYTVPL